MARSRQPAPVPAATRAASQIPVRTRRAVLAAAGAAAATGGLAHLLGPGSSSATAQGPVARAATGSPQRATGPHAAPVAAGTTLTAASTPAGAPAGYRRLTEGPGWPRVLRTELAAADSRRADRRTVLASFVQFTDLHVVDVQHPLRYEYLRAQTNSAWRPQETLSAHGTVSLVERVNALRGGPATGAPIGFVMTTGDNTDNNCLAELDWFLTAMSGGRLTPGTGDPARYEGVQDSGLPLYWHPDAPLRDADKKLGFPQLDGFLAAATRQVNSPGLHVPWYSTVGNHDALPGGCYAAVDGRLAEIAVGDRKLMELPQSEGAALWKAVKEGRDPRAEAFTAMLRRHAAKARTVTPDASRAPLSRADYLRAHLDPAHEGPGPLGHGYTQANVAEDRLYYTFRISDEVVGISLDTTRRGGHYKGAIGAAQLRWLEKELKKHRDDRVLVFSHHTSGSTPEGGEALVALLCRHPQVVAWINGHSHRNRITPHGTFWEVSTASHIDFPQLARVVEVTDNHDGTLSLFTTLVESAAPARTDFGDLSQTGLASLYRELAFNAPGARTTLAGAPGDRNTELLLPRP
ncbi:TIGR03767 family metallophosphoesterase [Streptomyces sp. 549]|uniref:TIGR03767 family metallophosphoesterase n=1 Tax=Streptomyces sp. 549 TaxID=3049076 RepID=UPI0024C32B05|nr:TIGR03767 family metallophosphoesterase [Streptomyces sp. 549]MDK1474426.1 TIGR03767 family metallophosphoesterase [Streptomyces sp. 549]